MALATTIIARTVWGNKRVVIGKGVISGTTDTGDVITGLNSIDMFLLDVAGGTQKGCSVNETLPLSKGDVTVVTESNDQTFYWLAIGN